VARERNKVGAGWKKRN